MQELVLTLFFLFLCVKKLVERFTVKALRDRVPPQSCHRNLHVILALDLLVSILNGTLRTIKSNFDERIAILIDGRSSKSAPKLSIQFKLNFFLFIWLPHDQRIHCLLDHFFVSILYQFEISKNFTGYLICFGDFGYWCHFFGSLCWWSSLCATSSLKNLFGNSSLDGVKRLSQMGWQLLLEQDITNSDSIVVLVQKFMHSGEHD